MAQAANQADFFGEGTADAAAAPDDPNDLPNPNNPGGVSNNELARQRLRQNQINSVDQSGYQSLGSVNTAQDILGTRKDSNGNTINIVRGTQAQNDAINNQMGAVTPVGNSLVFAPPGSPGTPSYNSGAASLGSDYVQQGEQQGNNLANQVLGALPTTNPATDPTRENMDRLTPVVDPALATSPETDRALAQSQDLINRILNAPLQTQILGDQALSSQLAIARGARGGPGAVAGAVDQAISSAPQIQQQTAQNSIQEQVSRAGAAGQAASIYAGVATNDANRAVNIATANQTAGTTVLQNLTALTGQQLNFDSNKIAALGQLARDYFANAQAFAQMDVTTQIATWDDLTRRYSIDVNAKTAIEAVAASKKVGPLDALKMVLGLGSSVAGIAGL